MQPDSLWLWIGLAVVAVAAVVIVVRLRGRERDGGVRRALAAVAVDSLENVLVPDGMGGVIHIEYLLLTARGVLVIDVKPYEGIIFASERMDDWTVIRNRARTSIANPIGALYDRVAAVRQVVRDVNVTGHILFPEGADFSKGRPKPVILPSALIAGYPLPSAADRERVTVAFQPYWERIKTAVEAEAGRH